MNLGKIKQGLYWFFMAFLVVLVASCPATTGGNGTGGSDSFDGTIYAEGMGNGLADPIYWNSKNKVAGQKDNTEVAKTGATSWEFTWTTDDWQGFAINASAAVDVSKYNAITFYAKAKDADATVAKFGFGAGDDAEGMYEAYLADTEVPAADWKQFVIPLPDASKLKALSNVFYVANSARNATIYLDDVKFVTLTGLTHDAVTSSEGDITVVEESSSQRPGIVTDGSTNLTKIVSKYTHNSVNYDVHGLIFNYMTWTSDATATATVDTHGTITGVKAGNAKITGTLKTKTLEINVTVTAKAPFTGVLYDDAAQGGFTVGSDSNGNTATLNPADAAEKSEGNNSISLDLANTADWGGVHIANANGVDASSYANIVFSINTAAFDTKTDPHLEIKIEDTDSTTEASTFYTVDLFTLTKTENANWDTYTIPLATIKTAKPVLDFSKFKGIGFWHPKSGTTFEKIKFYVDDVKFTN